MSRVVERVAARGVTRAKAALVQRLAGVRGVEAEETPAGVTVRGRRLGARWLTDARLRWIGEAW